MKTAKINMICLVLSASWPAAVTAADVPPTLAHNPFSRPPSEVSRDAPTLVESDDGSGPTLALHATMVGGASRLANVAGRILKPGDEIQGYLLIAIFEEYAVFRKDGRSLTVYVKPNLAENDE
jgi:hypothetical protein